MVCPTCDRDVLSATDQEPGALSAGSPMTQIKSLTAQSREQSVADPLYESGRASSELREHIGGLLS
jgi:hypothetical protein